MKMLSTMKGDTPAASNPFGGGAGAAIDPKRGKHLLSKMKMATKFCFSKFQFDHSYKTHGDEEMYTEEMMAKRRGFKESPVIRHAIAEFWKGLDSIKDREGCVRKEEYLLVNARLHKALIPDVTDEDAAVSGPHDWEKDCGKKMQMDYADFFESFFELADIWTEIADIDEYEAFLEHLSDALIHKNADGTSGLRTMHDVKRLEHRKSWVDTADVSERYSKFKENLGKQMASLSVAERAALEQTMGSLDNKQKIAFMRAAGALDAEGQAQMMKVPHFNTCFKDDTLEQ